MAAQYGSASARALGTSALEAQRLGKFAAGQHWSSAASSLNGWKMGGMLAFAPSAAIDLYKNVSRDAQGSIGFDGNQFLIDSAKSQSGNAAGWVGGYATGFVAVKALALAGVTLAGAPLILVVLGSGIAIQLVWGWQGMGDLAASKVPKKSN
jgi:hypothetical protein